jgi:hypothetical protein
VFFLYISLLEIKMCCTIALWYCCLHPRSCLLEPSNAEHQ